MNPENALTVCLGRELCVDHREQVITFSTRAAVRTAAKLRFLCSNLIEN